ncbi:MAG: membrane associated rhomboid family serine protease [Candidatus Nanohaloarchaea archaeon]|jgi:membrane associated rhomboid family serine protease
MAECSECGRESMSFKCKYCGEKFCSEHRLPEKHNCPKMDEKIEEEKEETEKWFKEEKVKNPAPSQKKPQYQKRNMRNEFGRLLKNNYTVSIILFTSLIYLFQGFLNGNPASPASNFFYDLFILKPALADVISQPWTLVTVMFLHGGLFHLFANMVTFYFFGKTLEKIVGGKELLKFYFSAGIAASIGFVAIKNLLLLLHGSTLTCIVAGACGPTLSVMSPAVGASGAVIAVFASVAMIYPDAEVLLYFVFPMKIKTALYAFAGLEIVLIGLKILGYQVPVFGAFASSAHLAGLIVGVWYGKKLRDRIGTRSTVLELM